MKAIKSLPVMLSAVVALVSATTIATAQNPSSDSSENTPVVASDTSKANPPGHAKGRHKQSHGGRENRGMMAQLFRQGDADEDGVITQEEVSALGQAKVASADSSGDGALSMDEFETLYREMTRTRMVRSFQKLDVDGDGSVNTEELDVSLGLLLEQMDSNGDGVLSIDDRQRTDRRKVR